MREQIDETSPTPAPRSRRLVWQLGWVSLFNDISSEAILPTLSFFVVGTLGAPAAAFGLMEGGAAALSSLLKAPAGYVSDLVSRRKPLVLLGYALSVCGKAVLPLSYVWGTVMGAQFLDRIGKGVRTSPRDGMLADCVEPARRGWAFGVNRAMDSAGAVLAPLLAAAFLWFYSPTQHADAYLRLYWLALIPAALALFVLALVREPARVRHGRAEGGMRAALPPDFHRYVGVMTLFSLVNSSDQFLLFRLRQFGWSPFSVLLAYAGFNAVAAAGSLPFGSLSDRIGRKRVLMSGLGVFAMVYLGFAIASPGMNWLPLALLVGYGLYYALTDGVGRAYAADLAGVSWRGSGLGVYHTAVGVAALPASVLAGALFDYQLPAMVFVIGAIGAGFAMLGLWLFIPNKRSDLAER